MIVKEFYSKRKDGVNLFRTYSDNAVIIRKDGTDEVYDDAIDIEGAPYTYSETDILIENTDQALERILAGQ